MKKSKKSKKPQQARVKRRNVFARRFRRWLYRLVVEEQDVAAENWQKDVQPCFWCQRPIPLESTFCQHCGFSLTLPVESTTTLPTTTGHQKLVNVLPVSTTPGTRERDQGRPVIITHEIASLERAGLRPVDAYNRMREGKQ